MTTFSRLAAIMVLAMAAKLTDDEREAIEELIRSGLSRNDIVERCGRSNGTVTRIAREIGWTFGQTNLAHAHDARSAYSAERRAELAARFTEECERLLDQLHEPHLAFNFGGKDNTYEEHELDEPPVDAKRALIQSAREAMRTVLDISRHDEKADEGAAVVDQWLRGVIGDSVQAAVN